MGRDRGGHDQSAHLREASGWRRLRSADSRDPRRVARACFGRGRRRERGGDARRGARVPRVGSVARRRQSAAHRGRPSRDRAPRERGNRDERDVLDELRAGVRLCARGGDLREHLLRPRARHGLRRADGDRRHPPAARSRAAREQAHRRVGPPPDGCHRGARRRGGRRHRHPCRPPRAPQEPAHRRDDPRVFGGVGRASRRLVT